jgi:hypothetical protein
MQNSLSKQNTCLTLLAFDKETNLQWDVAQSSDLFQQCRRKRRGRVAIAAIGFDHHATAQQGRSMITIVKRTVIRVYSI